VTEEPVTHREADEVPPTLRSQLESEPWARALGVEHQEISPGYCRVALTVQPHMLNHRGLLHGGVIFSLADVAFGAASNSRGKIDLAISMTISFLAAVAPGARLIAEGTELAHTGTEGFYDVRVRTEDGALVASASCLSHRVAGVRS
jgi:acyl-CoA thioesterase